MWANSQGNPAMEIVHFEKMGLNGLSSNLLILLESRLLRGREGSSLLVHALITLLLPPFTYFPLYFSILPILFLIPLFPLFFLIFRCFLSCYFFITCFSWLSACLSLYFFLLLLTSFPCSLCTAKAFLYSLPWWVLLFYPSITFGLVWMSFPDHPLVCWLPSHHHYLVLAVPCSIPRQKGFVLFSCSLWHSFSNKG